MIRACLSGSASCTGIAPCPQCDKAMLTQVIPRAMVAAGFNGNAQIAQAFFLAYKQAHDLLIEEVAKHITNAMPPPPQVPPMAPEPQAPPTAPEPEGFTEEDIAQMGNVESFVEEEPEPVEEPAPATFSPKAARAYARMARALKKRRATEKKEEDTHGKED